MRDPQEAVIRAHRAARLPAGNLVVGFSGGPDSCALLLALSRVGHWRLVAAHVDHGMHGGSSEVASRAAELAAAWGAACRIVRLERAPRNEDEARSARHEALAAVARELGGPAPAIALGHTADDQVETILLRVARGTGIAGLRGMGPWEPGPAGCWIARPLLALARKDVDAYLARLGIEPLADPTNADPAFSDRNRLRLGAIPVLREINPRLSDAVGRLADLAREDDAALEIWTDRELATIEAGGAIRLAPFRRLPLALRRRVLRRLAPDLSFDQVRQALGLAASGGPRHTHLAGGRVLVRERGWLVLRPGPLPDAAGCRFCLTQGGVVPSMERDFGI